MKSHPHSSTEEGEHCLYEAIAQLKTADEAQEFFHDLCSPAEISSMADRWRVVEPIIAGTPYRKIYEDTGVSVTTVGRIARCVNYGTGGYKLVYDRIRRKTNAKRQSKNRSTKQRSS